MDVRKLEWNFKDGGSKASLNEPPVKIDFLGARHPHVMYRFSILEQMGDFEFSGFYEEVESIATQLAMELPNLKRFNSPEALLDMNPDIVMIHSLDPDVPKWGSIRHQPSISVQGIISRETRCCYSRAFLCTGKEIRCKRPDLAVELGYEMHYSEAIEFARKVVKEGGLGDITTTRFHGRCPSGAGMDLWQSIREDLGGIMQTEDCHTLENIVGLFGPPERVVSIIRKLPERQPHPVVGWIPDLFSGTVTTDAFSVGTLMTVTLDMTAWEPAEWCNEWAIDIYGTNGSLHAVPDYPVAELYFREGTSDFEAGITNMTTEFPHGTSNVPTCYREQFESLFARVRGAKELKLENGCCGLEKIVTILKIIAAMYKSSKSR